MLAALSRSSRVAVALARSSAPVSTTSARLIDDPDQALKRKEAWRIDNEMAVLLPEEKKQHDVEVSRTVTVPSIPNLSPVTGIPEEHVRTRRVRIYMPPKNAMQSGTNNINFWQMEFDNRQRWENPLMGWTSTGDPLSNLKVEFQTKEAAIEHCEKHGWAWYIDEGKLTKEEKPKSYGVNFSWNRRTRVSTK